MKMEHKIIGMLEIIMAKLDEHTIKLDKHTIKLDEHSKKLDKHSIILNEHSMKLDKHSLILNEHSQKLDNHTSTLAEHGQILSALQTGQEHLKAEIDEMKAINTKEFKVLNQRMDDFTVQIDLLRDESWKNKVDIQRVKNVMGMR